MLPLNEKFSIRKEKNCMLKLLSIYSKNESSIYEIVKKDKEIYASFAVVPQTAKVTTTVHDNYLVCYKHIP